MAQSYVAGQSAEGASGDQAHQHGSFWALTIGCCGVVYGDIGTSPLYALREAVTAAKAGGMPMQEAVIGVLSLILWSLILIVTVKYVLVLLRADNKGEGGTFALMSLAQSVAKKSAPLLFYIGVVGAAFFFGDAMLTPAISVLSAVEGLKLATPAFEPYVVPLSVVIIVGLFLVQSRGTQKMATFFGPIVVVWFFVLALGGALHLIDDPRVFLAFNPLYGISFLARHGLLAFTVFGFVVLAVTGAEALYVDLGHFGRKPIQTAWFAFVLPALVLNYFGQGALILSEPEALQNPFYRLYPSWALYPMVGLATIATIIASQAVITGAYSLTRQAIQLGLLPRLAIRHTSESMAGQIYMPRVNTMLMIGVVLVVVMFQNSSRLASAYGVSIVCAMVLDFVMAFFVVWKYFRWPLWRTLALLLPLVMIEQGFLASTMLKIFEGGWFPLLIAGGMTLIMLTWVKGRRLLEKATRRSEADIDWLVRKLDAKPPHRVSGTAVFLTSDPTAAPTSLLHNLKHNRVLHERNVILSIHTEETPRVPNSERLKVEQISDGFIRVVAKFGFMETPSIPRVLALCRKKDLNIDVGATSFFLSRTSLRQSAKSEMPVWQETLFIGLARSAQDATTYFQIPTDRVVEVGTQVAI